VFGMLGGLIGKSHMLVEFVAEDETANLPAPETAEQHYLARSAIAG